MRELRLVKMLWKPRSTGTHVMQIRAVGVAERAVAPPPVPTDDLKALLRLCGTLGISGSRSGR